MDNRVEFALNLEEFPAGFGDEIMDFNSINRTISQNSAFSTANSPGDTEIKSEGDVSPSFTSAYVVNTFIYFHVFTVVVARYLFCSMTHSCFKTGILV